MVDLEKAEKLPKERRYFNISIIWIFYFRYAIRLFYFFKIPHEILTLGSIGFGFISAYYFYHGSLIIAAVTIHLKDILDASDGAIARLTDRGHLIGRYLDSVGDFAALTAILGAIALYAKYHISETYLIWGGIAILSTFIQCSFFNYYQLAYLETFGIQSLSSKRNEIGRDDLNKSFKSPPLRFLLKGLHFLYIIIYSWQDKLVAVIDNLLLNKGHSLSNDEKFSNKTLMALQSALCFGTHIFIIIIFALLGKPEYSLIFISLIMNIYLLIVLYLRKRYYRARIPVNGK